MARTSSAFFDDERYSAPTCVQIRVGASRTRPAVGSEAVTEGLEHVPVHEDMNWFDPSMDRKRS